MTTKPTREELGKKIYVALDVSNFQGITDIVGALAGKVGGFKVGLQAGTALGWFSVSNALKQRDGGSFFADTKFHDIPNTVEQASCELATFPGVGVFNVHASGGPKMIAAARKGAEAGAERAGHPRPLLLAVTWLTSLGQDDLTQQGISGSVTDHVVRLGTMAIAAGADGLVCSTAELTLLRAELGEGPLLVVPGIRLPTSDQNDQARVGTPGGAIKAGATHLVIGRELNDPKSTPAQRLERLDRIIDNMVFTQ